MNTTGAIAPRNGQADRLFPIYADNLDVKDPTREHQENYAEACSSSAPEQDGWMEQSVETLAAKVLTLPFSPVPMDAIMLLDRDLSIVAFQRRVFSWAQREDIPLLERLRYLTIVSSNLDEFFEVRAAQHVTLARMSAQSRHAGDAQHVALFNEAQRLVALQYQLYNQSLVPALADQGVCILSHAARSAAQRRWVGEYFHRVVMPLLVPVGLDPSHPFPKVANKSLNFIVRLEGRDAYGRDNEIAIVRIPRVLPRMIRLPVRVAGKKVVCVSLSSIVRAHLEVLFPGRKVTESAQFRVTRHSDLAVDEEELGDLRLALRQGLQQRQFGEAVRLEVSAGCSERLVDFLCTEFDLPEAAVFRVEGPVNLVRLSQLIDLVDRPDLLFAPAVPAWPKGLRRNVSMMAQLRKRDVLVHQPFESFDCVLTLLREAVEDPQVLAIKQTIYRTGSDPQMLDLLREATRRGKEVMAVVELKARFDEEANINWAEALESAGAQVVYGVVGLKTHAKMLLITRREGRGVRRYGHLSTGNYNPRTARLYTDLSHFTADADTTADMDTLFTHLAGQNQLPPLKKLWMAPFHLHAHLTERVHAAARCAAKGGRARIVLKMNALTDEALVRSLLQAGQSGVEIDLIVRGACILPAQCPGVSDRIRVRSVVGRFLEHSRVFYFDTEEEQVMLLSSADWMQRNMRRRVELAWPVTDADMRQRVWQECLLPYLRDGANAWELQCDGQYQTASPPSDALTEGAQTFLARKYAIASVEQGAKP